MAANARTTEAMLVPLGVGLGASVFFGVLSFLLAGAGHGTYVPMILCFPYAMGLAALHGSIEIPHIALALLQFPVYGAVLGVTRFKGRTGRLWAALGTLHVASVALAVFAAAKGGNFLQ